MELVKTMQHPHSIELVPELANYLADRVARTGLSESEVVMCALGLLAHCEAQTSENQSLVVATVISDSAHGIALETLAVPRADAASLTALSSFLLTSSQLTQPRPKPPYLRRIK
jgi:hypothetical protein